MANYGLNIWGNNNFIIENGKVCVNKGIKPALYDIVEEIREDGIRGPILLRFPHLIKNRLILFTIVLEKQKSSFITRVVLMLYIH